MKKYILLLLTIGILFFSSCTQIVPDENTAQSDILSAVGYSATSSTAIFPDEKLSYPDTESDTVGTGENGQSFLSGERGKDGKDGKDGTDGKDGKDGQDGTDGKDGKDGKDGTDGKGIREIFIEDGIVFVLYDGEETAVAVGKLLEETKCTVTFHYGDKTESATVAKGECIDLPLAEREGQEFLGWYTGETVNDTHVTSYTPVSRDMDLFARYQKTTYTLTYYVNGKEYLAVQYSPGATVIAEELPQGIISWSGLPSEMPERDVAVFGNAPNQYTVTFCDYDGKILKPETVVLGADATPPDPPTRQGYLFTRWEGNYTDIHANTEVVAVYTVCEYTVRFLVDDKSVEEQKVAYKQSAATPKTPTKEGYVFKEWSKPYNCITEDTNIEARFSRATYTVTFKDFDGTTLGTPCIVEHGADATPPDPPTRQGYVFTEWNNSFVNVTSDRTVTAQYSILSYTVKFLAKKSDDEKYDLIDTQSVEYGSFATLPTRPAPSGYKFTEWDKKVTEYPITEDTEFKTEYEKTNIPCDHQFGGYTVKEGILYHSCGKCGNAYEQTVLHGFMGTTLYSEVLLELNNNERFSLQNDEYSYMTLGENDPGTGQVVIYIRFDGQDCTVIASIDY